MFILIFIVYIHATCPVIFILLHVVTLKYLTMSLNYETPVYNMLMTGVFGDRVATMTCCFYSVLSSRVQE
jgi:hypothetical protein